MQSMDVRKSERKRKGAYQKTEREKEIEIVREEKKRTRRERRNGPAIYKNKTRFCLN